MASTDILPFATGGSANVETQAAYAADPTTGTGFVAGTAASVKLNKVWRQSSFIAAGIANMLVNRGITVADDGNLTALIAEIEAGMNAFLDKSVAGGADVTLSPTLEANYPIINFTGILTGNINVIFPQRPGSWIIKNSTTGAFTLTLKMTTGATIAVQQGTSVEVFSNGIDMQLSSTSGATPPQFDNDTSLATTEFVQLAGHHAGKVIQYTANQVIPDADIGGVVVGGGAGGYTLTLPAATSGKAKQQILFTVQGVGSAVTIARSGADVISNGGTSSATSIVLRAGDWALLTCYAAGLWLVTAGTPLLSQGGTSGAFGASLAASGFQMFPSGLIIQWGTTTSSSSSAGVSTTFPIAFPNSCLSVAFGISSSSTGLMSAIESKSANAFVSSMYSGNTTRAAGIISFYIAVGA